MAVFEFVWLIHYEHGWDTKRAETNLRIIVRCHCIGRLAE